MNNDQYNRRDDNRPAGQLSWSEPAPAVTNLVDAMVDIESLGTTPGSAILSIGAVMFGPAGLGETFYAPVLLQSCTAIGLTIDPNTIAWWMQQSDAARAAAFRDDAAPLATVLEQFSNWFSLVRAERPWSQGANFDPPLLDAAYRACGMTPPWKYWNVRDTRTLYDLAGVKVDRSKGTHHNALDDARVQAEAAVVAMQRVEDMRQLARGSDGTAAAVLAARAEGRAEAVEILAGLCPETGLSDFIGWSKPVGPEDEGSSYWHLDKLRELFKCDDKLHNLFDRADEMYWRARGEKDQAEMEMRMVERAPFYKPLHDFLSKHQAYDLMADLKCPAATSGSELAGHIQGLADSLRFERDCPHCQKTFKDAECDVAATTLAAIAQPATTHADSRTLRARFDAWWPTLGQTIGEVAAWEAAQFFAAPAIEQKGGGAVEYIGKLRATLHSIANTLDDKELRAAAKEAYASPTPAADAVQTAAARDVLAERRRQIKVKGRLPEHDDECRCDEIAAYATFYVMPPAARDWPADETSYGATWGTAIVPADWTPPKSGDRRRELVKAGALILAEIERLDRAADAAGKDGA